MNRNNHLFESDFFAKMPALRERPQLGLGAVLIGQEEEDLVMDVVRSKRLFRYSYDLPPKDQGKMTATLEKETREMMGVRFALAVTSGTAALEVALAALEIGPGDEVIVPAWSWVSCFTSIVRVGARPVLAEIDETFCLAPGEIRRLRTSRTKAVMVIHYQGVAAEMDAILSEAQENGLAVIEDCAEATGARYRGRRVGSLGTVGIYSFQNQKTMTSGEGGMVVTNDPKLYERSVRFHDIGHFRPHHHLFASPREMEFCGSQFRMNELTAAVALAQLRKVDGLRAHCRVLSRRIMDRIGRLEGLVFRRIPDPEGDSGIEIYFHLETEQLAQTFTAALAERNVHCLKMTGTYCHYSKSYCTEGRAHAPGASPFLGFSAIPPEGYRAEDFPRTESLVHRFVALPMGARFTLEDADYIAATVCAIHQQMGAIAQG